MTQEEKHILLVDLCARLPYHTYVSVDYIDEYNVHEVLNAYHIIGLKHYTGDDGLINIKPYLRPMSSMTEEEFSEYYNIKYNKITHRDNYKRIDVGKFHNVGIIPIEEYIDWLNSHHFDYRGLIEKGLALEASNTK